MAARSANFRFLQQHDSLLEGLAAQAEKYVDDDPNTALIKLRQFAERLARAVADDWGIEILEEDDFHGVLEKLYDEGDLPKVVAGALHALRREGNRAVHEHQGTADEAAEQLENARKIAVWFHQIRGSGGAAGAGRSSARAPTERRVGGKKRAVTAAPSRPRASTASRESAAAKKKKQAAAKKKSETAAKRKAAAAKKKKEAAAKKRKQAADKKKKEAAAKKKKQAAAKKKKDAAAKKRGQAAAKKKKDGAAKRRKPATASAAKKIPAKRKAARSTARKPSPAKKRSSAKAKKAGKGKGGIAGWASALADWWRG